MRLSKVEEFIRKVVQQILNLKLKQDSSKTKKFVICRVLHELELSHPLRIRWEQRDFSRLSSHSNVIMEALRWNVINFRDSRWWLFAFLWIISIERRFDVDFFMILFALSSILLEYTKPFLLSHKTLSKPWLCYWLFNISTIIRGMSSQPSWVLVKTLIIDMYISWEREWKKKIARWFNRIINEKAFQHYRYSISKFFSFVKETLNN